MFRKSTIFFLFPFLIYLQASSQDGAGLLWSVVKPGSKDTSYLLGTLHKYPETVVALPKVVGEKLGKCRNLYLEMQLDWKMVWKMLTSSTISSEMMVEESQEWTNEDWAKVREWFITEGMLEEKEYDRISSITTGSRLMELYLAAYGYSFGAIEDDLKNIAKVEKIKVKGLDRNWQEIQTWYAHYARGSSQMWESGNLDSLLYDGYYQLADLFIAYAIQDTSTIYLYDRDEEWENGMTLVAYRNHQWMAQLPQLMQEKTFVAVGAAHLFGPHGVVNLLRQANFLCQPVPAHFGGQKLERFIRRNSRQYQLPDDEVK